MKKFRAIAFTAIILFAAAFSVSAKNGDVLGSIYKTDIRTQFCGRDIPSFSINGETMIVVEDLMNYGYKATYDNDYRLLTAVYNTEPLGETDYKYQPISKAEIGIPCGYYYDSDIKVIINGEMIKSYSLNGRTAVKVEELGVIKNYDPLFPASIYGMTAAYDDSKRLLTFENAFSKYPEKQAQINEFIENKAKYTNNCEDIFAWSHLGTYEGEGFSIVHCSLGGLPHGPMQELKIIYDTKQSYNLQPILRAYGFRTYWGDLDISGISVAGNTLVFTSQRRLFDLTFTETAGYVLNLEDLSVKPYDYDVTPVLEAEVAQLVNIERESVGIDALVFDEALSAVAKKRAAELVESFAHVRPDGTACFTAFDENGIKYGYAGENIAMGQQSAKLVMSDWMNSRGHKDNIMKVNFKKIGVGCIKSDNRYYWVQLFTD